MNISEHAQHFEQEMKRRNFSIQTNVCDNHKHKVILSLLYSAGLRVSELINLRWKDIDRSRMIINVIQAEIFFARYFIEKNPEHSGVFELRKLRNEEAVLTWLKKMGS